MYFHWQNLNDKPSARGVARKGSPLRHGRAWLDLSKVKFRCEWSCLSSSVGATIDLAQHDDAIQTFFGCGLFAVWLSMEQRSLNAFLERITKRKGEKYGDGRTIGVRFFSDKMWVSIWEDPNEWNSKDPRWWKFTIDPMTILFGKRKYSKVVVEEGRLLVPMPEKTYGAKYQIYEASWKRPRLPWALRVMRGEAEYDEMIGHPGKGENSWDCGPDGSYSLTCNARNKAELIGQCVESVMRSRIKYGGRETSIE